MVGIAQLGRALDCGSSCRGFESRYPPQFSFGKLGPELAMKRDEKERFRQREGP